MKNQQVRRIIRKAVRSELKNEGRQPRRRSQKRRRSVREGYGHNTHNPDGVADLLDVELGPGYSTTWSWLDRAAQVARFNIEGGKVVPQSLLNSIVGEVRRYESYPVDSYNAFAETRFDVTF